MEVIKDREINNRRRVCKSLIKYAKVSGGGRGCNDLKTSADRKVENVDASIAIGMTTPSDMMRVETLESKSTPRGAANPNAALAIVNYATQVTSVSYFIGKRELSQTRFGDNLYLVALLGVLLLSDGQQ
ncbi:hypothetical protein CEXT_154211 [Caerostris extrusa]|uniref:Uncharacterized protein n=1 Tax=Caerostris extrusa TaxID=172846 RepID=A0AAV4X658_CAEEX|nr:hypothetical protein CEXT_154211 [Caerostris extrusa]